MVAIPVAKAIVGVSSYEKNGNMTLNCTQNLSFPCGFLISRKPIFGISLKTRKVKQNCVFSHKKCSFLVVNGLPNIEFLEKDFEFKPAFDEYLKTMESIRTGRDMKQVSRSDGEKDEMDNSRLHSSGGIPENVPLGDRSEGQKSWKKFESSKLRELNRNSNAVYSIGLANSDIGIKQGRHVKLMDTGEMGLKGNVNSRAAHSFIRDDLICKETEANSSVKKKLETNRANSRWIKNQKDSELSSVRASFRSLGLRKGTVRNEQISKKSNYEQEEMERAAFKQFEGSINLLDEPRVSRMDMEERIQKLANCLNGADINMPEWVFSKMMRSAKIRFSDHSMVRVIQILGKLGNWRRVLQVIEWIQLRERFKSHKIRYIYTAALDVLGKARRPVEALNVFTAMQEHMSTYPDLVAYHCIAVTLGQAGHMKELFDVIDSMRSPPKKKLKTGVFEKWDPRLEPDIVVYNAVLNACVRRKQWEGAFWVLQQLKQQNTRPSSTTYGLVMEVMLACDKYNLVHEFFRKVQKTSIPNALTYKVLVNTLWKEGKTDEAILAVEEMESRGIIGSSGLYYDLARCLCSAGRCQEALMQIGKICKVANKPLVVTYTGLIQACLNSGNIDDGIYIFDHMQQRFCSPNLVTCNIMLKAYLENGMFELAKTLFQKMLEDGKERVVPDIYTFNTMLDACLEEQRWDDLEYVYKKMMRYGYYFNEKRHLSMVLDACRAGKVEMLETTWKHLVKAGRIPPPLILKEMLHIKLAMGDYSAALSCIASYHRCGGGGESPPHVFSHKAWLNFFEKNANSFKKNTLVRFVEEGTIFISKNEESTTTSLSLILLRNLITSCREFLREGGVHHVMMVSADDQTRTTVCIMG